jgi:hypothetical protein
MEVAFAPDGMSPLQTASMFSDEPVSDHPQAVCPVIAAFLRTYDVNTEDDRREEVLRWAVLAIGTRGGMRGRQERARRSRDLCRRLGVSVRFGRVAGSRAARALLAVEDPDERHRSALAFVDDLVRVGGSPSHRHALPPDVRRRLHPAISPRGSR